MRLERRSAWVGTKEQIARRGTIMHQMIQNVHPLVRVRTVELAGTCCCVEGYGGVLCGDDIIECLSSPCVNGGTCKDDIEEYRWECPEADVEEHLEKAKKTKTKRDKSKGRAAKTDETPLSPEDPNDKSTTKVIFDQYLNSYYGNSKQRKLWNLSKRVTMCAKINRTRKPLLANLYDPEDTKTGKSNKRREKERGRDKPTGMSNEAFVEEKDSKSAKERRNKSPEIIENLSRKNKKQTSHPGLVKRYISKFQSNERDQSQTREGSPNRSKKKGKQSGRGVQDSERLSDDEEDVVYQEIRKKKKKKVPVLSSDNETQTRDTEDSEVGVVRRKKKPKTKVPVSEKETWTGEDEDSEPTIRRKKKSKIKQPVSDKETWTGEDEDMESGVRRRKKKRIKDHSVSDKETWTGEDEDIEPGVRKKKKKKVRAAASDKETWTGEDEELEPGVRKKKKKKIRVPVDDEATCTWEDEDLEPGVRKKRKKKIKPPGTDKETLTEGEQEEAEDDTKAKKKKKKKKKVELTDRETAMNDSVGDLEIPDSGEIFAVTIHRTGKLKTDFIISHPVVRVHVVNEDTGMLLNKQHKDRPVTSFYEQDRKHVDVILPIMTQPFDFKQNMSTLPIWEELLMFNENYNYFVTKYPRVVLFFEILDFVSMHRASERVNGSRGDGGWHRIAWAFLKVVSDTDVQNTERRLRLQLYETPSHYHPRPDSVEVYQWWKRCRLNKYPSTIYVTVKGIIPPKEVEPAARSMFATQGERGTVEFNQLSQRLEETSRRRGTVAKVEPSQWTRLSGQLCRVPNCLALNLPAGGGGCFVIRFSHDGKTLACGCHDKDGFPIILYEIPSGEVKGQLQGHYGMTYDLCWSKKDKQLVSASADATVRVWNVEKPSTSSTKVLPHPTYVYTAKFHPRVTKVVVTGCYDHILRIWSLQGDSPSGELLQELDQHHSFINSVCFDSDGKRLFSADSVGVIYMWNVYVTELPSSKGLLRDWTLNTQLKDKDLEGVAVSCLEVHPNNNRLLVHSRDNVIRMFDLRIGGSGMMMQKYFGGLNFRELIHSSFTPCGSFVFAGSEDNCAYVWNTETGDQVAVYTELGYQSPVSDVQFHPHDHIVAFCAFGDNHPVLVYKFDHEVAQKDVGMEAGDRARSPELKPSFNKSDNEELETARSRVSTARDMFKAEETAKMDRVMSLLHSVKPQSSSSSTLLVPQHPLAVPYGSASTLGQSTWGSTFDTTMFTKSSSRILDPSTMSPHSVTDTRSLLMQQQQQLSTQAQYMEYNQAGDRPGFLSVGRLGMQHSVGSPQISLTATPGKPQFSYQSLTSGKEEEYEKVVALYDYKAQRSDELSLRCGDLLPNGQQGFFPSNYVTDSDRATARPSDSLEHIVDIHASDDDDTKPSHFAAVVSKSGELKIFSGPEDSDTETPLRSCGKKKKKGKRREPTVLMMDEVLPSPIIQGKMKKRHPRETNDSEV
ncbi:Jouberin [Lamellibrachia satsuma]|nr:Jouberin [Lamellibrachia satsuma]